MSERVVDLIRNLSSGDLEGRLQSAAGAVGAAPLESQDLLHLLRVLTNPSLVVTPIFQLIKFNDLIDAHFHPGTLPLLTATAEDEATLHRLLTVPDHVRVLGDKCLFETGVAGRKGPEGLDFEDLGRKSYSKAAQILSVLSRDPRLRHFYEQNALDVMSIEEEVGFLERCSESFTTHVRLLQEVLDEERSTVLHASGGGPLASASRRGEGRARALSPRSGSPAPAAPAAPGDEDAEDEPPRPRFADLQLVRRSDEENDELRFRELVAAEKTVLFSALDTELLRTELKKVVIQQDLAIDSLCDELCLYSTGTQDPSKPASYFLVGPTGVGKNHLVESTLHLFERLWGIEVPYLELEGPEFTYPSDINELKGAARGFIRSDEEGIMTQFHARAHDKPISVILVDEVEKAHPQLRRFFLPIMDRGTMMDNRGKVLHFENALIFFTSNVGYSDAARSTSPIGYGDDEARERSERGAVETRIKKALSPEFINRVHFLHFRHLDRDAVDEIFDLELERIQVRYAQAQQLEIAVSTAARQELINRGYNRDYGARNLSKVLNRWANIEVSKELKRDQSHGAQDITSILSMLREMRDGQREFDGDEVRHAVERCSRLEVPYRKLTVDFRNGDFQYDKA